MSIQPTDLAEFTQRDDGNIEVKLDRFGRLIVTSPHSGIVLDLNIRRVGSEFHFFLNTRASDDPKAAVRAVKANKGKPVGATYTMALDGTLNFVEGPAVTAAQIDQATGRKAAAAASAPEEKETQPADETEAVGAS